MKWFKHYENASSNKLIQALIADNKLEDGMRYWLLLEALCGEFKKEKTVFVFSEAQLKEILRIKFSKKLKDFCEKLNNFSATFDQKLLNFQKIENNFWKIETPIILELMGKDFKRSRHKSVNDTSKNKEERIKNKEERITPLSPTLSHEKFDRHLFDNVVNEWNNICGNQAPFKFFKGYKSETIKNFFNIVSINPELRKIETWKECFLVVKSNDLLSGQKNNSSFVCNLGWLIDQQKIIDVLNGQYGAVRSAQVITDDNLDEQYKIYLEKKQAEKIARGASNA